MALRDRLQRLEKSMRGQLGHFELANGQRHYFDPQAALRDTFSFFAQSMDADHRSEPRPEPPPILEAVARAKDRRAALDAALDGYSHLPIDREALIERGELKPRSLVAGKTYEDFGVLEDLSES